MIDSLSRAPSRGCARRRPSRVSTPRRAVFVGRRSQTSWCLPSRSGSFKAVVQLSAQQRQALEKNALYIQIHSEKAPEGNLWGWLLPQEVKR